MIEHVWTDAQFDAMSWHDNHVHALRLVAGEHGAGDLVLDIDHIVEWIPDASGFRFRVVPAWLTFRNVANLRLHLDFATPTAAFGPFSIEDVERNGATRERHAALAWRIVFNWPDGDLAFDSTGFVQRARGVPVVNDAQVLRPEQRGHHD